MSIHTHTIYCSKNFIWSTQTLVHVTRCRISCEHVSNAGLHTHVACCLVGAPVLVSPHICCCVYMFHWSGRTCRIMWHAVKVVLLCAQSLKLETVDDTSVWVSLGTTKMIMYAWTMAGYKHALTMCTPRWYHF